MDYGISGTGDGVSVRQSYCAIEFKVTPYFLSENPLWEVYAYDGDNETCLATFDSEQEAEKFMNALAVFFNTYKEQS